MAANSNEITNLYRVPLYDTFLRYREQFEPTVMEYDLPQKYFYKPKLVSYEIYQTTEMWIALLRLNKMRNVTEFRKPKIKIYDPDSVTDLIQLFFKREGKIS
jgi:hypothetical protein